MNGAHHFYGVQIGLLCTAREGTYLQIGLWTERDDGVGERPWYTKGTPFIGFHREKKKDKQNKIE